MLLLTLGLINGNVAISKKVLDYILIKCFIIKMWSMLALVLQKNKLGIIAHYWFSLQYAMNARLTNFLLQGDSCKMENML